MSYSSAIFYIDHVNGNDAARTALTSCIASNPSGTITRINKAAHGLITGAVVDLTLFTAWLNSAWKITKVDDDNFDLDGAVWQATADANGTVTPRGGQSWTDAWKTMSSGASAQRVQPLDVIRIAKSPAPASIGTAKWTNGVATPTSYKTIASSTNTSPISIHIVGHGYTTGDIVFIQNHSTNTNANGFWQITVTGNDDFTLDGSTANGTGGASGQCYNITSRCILLATADLTKQIDPCEVSFTSTNSGVVGTGASMQKQGLNVCKIGAPTSGVTTNKKYAFKAFDAPMDLSAFQEISFWAKGVYPATLATWWKVCLCSDTAGDTVVDTFYLPAFSSGGNFPVTLARDGGGNLGASIQSIAFYSNSVAPNASSYIYVDNIIATKTNGINLSTLISKNSEEQGGTEAWYGIMSIVDKIVMMDYTLSTTPASSGLLGYSGTSEQVETYIRMVIPRIGIEYIRGNGNYTEPVEYQGGYNTATNEQDGETAIEFTNGSYGVDFNSCKHVILTHITSVRSTGQGFHLYGKFINARYINAVSCTQYGIASEQSEEITASFGYSVNNGMYGVRAYAGSVGGQPSIVFRDGATAGNLTSSFYADGKGCTFRNVTFKEPFSIRSTGLTYAPLTRVGSNREGNVDDVHYTYLYGGYVASSSTNRHTASGISWGMYPTSVAASLAFPLILPVAQVACSANLLVTIKIWMMKTSATGVGGKLVCRGGQIKGVDLDVIATKADDTDWEELTITFTPTEFGIVTIEAIAYYISSLTDTVYVDDMTITQAES